MFRIIERGFTGTYISEYTVSSETIKHISELSGVDSIKVAMVLGDGKRIENPDRSVNWAMEELEE